MTTSPQKKWPQHGLQRQSDTGVTGMGGHSLTPNSPSTSTMASSRGPSPSDTATATESLYTTPKEAMEERIHFDELPMTHAMTMGHESKKAVRSPISTPSESESESSVEDLEEFEDNVASRLTEQAIGVQKRVSSDLTLVSKRAVTPTRPNDTKTTLHEPPSELMPLPPKRATPFWRRLRHQLLMVYQRLFSIVLLGNVAAFVAILLLDRDAQPFGPSLGNVASAVAANVTGAILIRQEYFINAWFDLFCWTPLWMPLRIRRLVAKFYHFGGIHSGCAVSAVMWFILFAALVTKQYVDGDFKGTPMDIAVLCITYTLLLLFLSITVFALPAFRMMSHNTFEAVHRFGGWLAVALIWVLLLLLNSAQSKLPASPPLGILVIRAPAFWLLLYVSLSIIFPWLRLRHVPVHAERLSEHAIRLHFTTYIKKIGPVVGIRIATSPLKEWHAFATIPSAEESCFSILISDAGDWTKRQIASPASHYWVRGIPVTGVLRMAAVFKKVVVVTTGSGIGPVLSMMVSSHRMTTSRILWSTPDPLQTYGRGICDAVVKADKEAVIWNTRERGRPDMIALTYHMYKKYEAEAVFVISNPKLTRKVVYAMEARGVPAFGPIWDS